MANVTVKLTADNMGDNADEAAFDAWVQYVAEHIDERCKFPVEVESFRFDAAQAEDELSISDCSQEEYEAKTQTVRDALDSLWSDWCADGAPGVRPLGDLKRAAEHISATELADGTWAHYAAETRRWYVVTAGELAMLYDYLNHEHEQIRQDAYSHWCAGAPGNEMPEGWTPDAAGAGLQIGSPVAGGKPETEDYDIGIVVGIEDDQVTVAWESGVRTTQSAALLSRVAS